MDQYSIKQLSELLQEGQCSSVELTQYYLKRISQNQDLNAFISINEEQALALAAQADLQLNKKTHKKLTGIPMAVKDLFCTQEMRTTCGSKMLSNFYAHYDASIVSKLKEHGALLLGKTNMDEFAMGSSNENSYFGPVKNPWDKERVSGGSSGGSAAAVAAGLIPFALGSDTGGSVRQPAAFCGISGIKPTYGLLSRYGMTAYASSLDQAGPMARRVADLALILECVSGWDPRDSTSIKKAAVQYTTALHKQLPPLRIGLPTAFFQAQVAPGIQQAVLNAVKVFEGLGAEFIEIELKLQPLWVPCYYVLACAEASSNLARYDGLRFGHRSKQASNLKDSIIASRSEGFGIEVKRRILTGTHVLSSGYFDAYYLQAQKIRRLIQNELLTSFQTLDLILGPTTPTTAFKLGVPSRDPIQNYLADVFTVAANLAGLPALSIPIGFDEHLPVGLQLMGTHFSEDLLLQAAHHYQLNTSWHLASPKS